MFISVAWKLLRRVAGTVFIMPLIVAAVLTLSGVDHDTHARVSTSSAHLPGMAPESWVDHA